MVKNSKSVIANTIVTSPVCIVNRIILLTDSATFLSDDLRAYYTPISQTPHAHRPPKLLTKTHIKVAVISISALADATNQRTPGTVNSTKVLRANFSIVTTFTVTHTALAKIK